MSKERNTQKDKHFDKKSKLDRYLDKAVNSMTKAFIATLNSPPVSSVNYEIDLKKEGSNRFERKLKSKLDRLS